MGFGNIVAHRPMATWAKVLGAFSLGGVASKFPGGSKLLACDAGLADSAGEGTAARIF